MIAKTDVRTVAAFAVAVAVGLSAFVASCGGSTPAPPVGVSVVAGPSKVDFAFDSLDERPVTGEAMRGKPTLMVFVQTGDRWSPAQVNYFVVMAKNDADKINYVLVALEPRSNRELVEAYKGSLNVTFPVALADPSSLMGSGPFGKWIGLPTLVLLDRSGRVRWRVDGHVVRSDEIRAQLRELDRIDGPR